MVFERRTLPVATLPVDISFVSLWGGEASRAMVSLAGPFKPARRLSRARNLSWLHDANTGAGFAVFQRASEPGRRAGARNPGTVNQKLEFTSDFK
jgi:hypothetical protein